MLKEFIKYLIKPSPEKALVKGGGKLGSGCEIYPEVEFGSEPYLIEIGDNVRITNGVKFVTHDGGLWVLRNLGQHDIDLFGKIRIGNNVHIGWNAIIMPGVTIGDNVVIGCGAVVTKDIPSNSVAAGVPAKVLKTLDEYAHQNEHKFLHTKLLTPKEKKEYIQSITSGNEEKA